MNLRVRLRTGGRFCSAAPWAGVHPADLNQSGNLHSHLSKSGQTLEKNGLLRSPGGQQTEPPVGDVLHSSTEDRRFLSGLKRRQLGSLEFSPDGIARVLSFCPRWLRITPRKDLQTHDGHKGFRKLRTTFKAGRRWTAVPPSPRSCNRTRKGRYLDVDPHPDNRARFGIPSLQNRHTSINPYESSHCDFVEHEDYEGQKAKSCGQSSERTIARLGPLHLWISSHSESFFPAAVGRC